MNSSTSEITISKSALKNNISFLRREMGKNTRISSVVKGNAYGHGIHEFIPLALENKINHFSVFSANEAYSVLQASDKKMDVMIMGMVEGEELEWAIQEGVEFYVFEEDRLRNAIRIAKKLKKRAKIHVELETGMNRTGFSSKQFQKVINILEKYSDHLEFKGLCTHYAGAESIANYLRVEHQIRNYHNTYQGLLKGDILPEMRHTACSAAAMVYPQTRMDLVRIGIMQYGLWPGPEIFIHYLGKKKTRKDPLQPVISWKSRVMSVKSIGTGEFVGYGNSYQARENMKIAVVPVGYADGYTRSLSNQGRALIRGHRVGVVGVVNMNMLLLNISEVPDAVKGDEVVLIGKQGDQTISVASFGEFSNQLNYELLARLPSNIKRVVID